MSGICGNIDVLDPFLRSEFSFIADDFDKEIIIQTYSSFGEISLERYSEQLDPGQVKLIFPEASSGYIHEKSETVPVDQGNALSVEEIGCCIPEYTPYGLMQIQRHDEGHTGEWVIGDDPENHGPIDLFIYEGNIIISSIPVQTIFNPTTPEGLDISQACDSRVSGEVKKYFIGKIRDAFGKLTEDDSETHEEEQEEDSLEVGITFGQEEFSRREEDYMRSKIDQFHDLIEDTEERIDSLYDNILEYINDIRSLNEKIMLYQDAVEEREHRERYEGLENLIPPYQRMRICQKSDKDFLRAKTDSFELEGKEFGPFFVDLTLFDSTLDYDPSPNSIFIKKTQEHALSFEDWDVWIHPLVKINGSTRSEGGGGPIHLDEGNEDTITQLYEERRWDELLVIIDQFLKNPGDAWQGMKSPSQFD